jgi:hypothetical protein
MNFIAAMFLTFLPEEESFWMLVGECLFAFACFMMKEQYSSHDYHQ